MVHLAVIARLHAVRVRAAAVAGVADQPLISGCDTLGAAQIERSFALSVTPWLGVDTSLLRLARLARLVHLMRHVSHLRLIRFFRVDAVVVAGAGLALAAVFMGTAVLSLNPLI